MNLRVLVVTGILLIVAAPVPGGPSRTLTGFTRDSSAAQLQDETRLARRLDAGRVDKDLRELTREPHPAGTERNNQLAHYVADAFRAAGLEDVTEVPYDVLMSYPKSISVEMTAPRRHRATIAEDVYEVDPDTANPRLGLPYHGFSASGEVETEVVYARNGNVEDYEYLKSAGIDVRGQAGSGASLGPLQLPRLQGIHRRTAGGRRAADLLRPEGRRVREGEGLPRRAVGADRSHPARRDHL